MNEEIKEILLIIKSCKQDYDKQKNGMHTFDYGELYLLYDYITNLQQENEYLKKNNPEQNIEHFRIIKENKRKINNLREENKTLKEQLESVINENQRLLKQWFEDNDKTVKLVSEKECYKSNYNDYKSRCEKAIEYLDKIETLATLDGKIIFSINIFKNILQNGSDENVSDRD